MNVEPEISVLHQTSLSATEQIFHIEALSGNLKNFIEKNINSKDAVNQKTILHKMAESESGDSNTVEYLLNLGAEIDAEDNAGQTPLERAVAKGNIEIGKCLIYNGANTDSKIKSLWRAVNNGHFEFVKLLFDDQYITNIDIKDHTGQTFLHYPNIEIGKYLISKGANVEVKNNAGLTPLHYAVSYGQFEYAKMLIAEGAQIEPMTNKGVTPLHCAANKGYLEIAKFLIDKGAQIHSKTNNNGWTPLHFAMQECHLEMAKLLTDKGAQIDAKTNRESTPLHLIAKKGNVNMAKFLIGKGAQIEAKDNNGMKALHFACRGGFLEMTKFLVEHGAQIETRNNNNETPFFLSNRENHDQIAKYLLEKKREEENRYPETASSNALCIICMEQRGGFYVLNPCGVWTCFTL